MKKMLCSIIFVSCFFGTGIEAAQAAKKMNVDAITTVPLHVRSGPGKSYKSLDVLPPDFPLVVGNCSRQWCHVYYNGKNGMHGWSSVRYLAFKENGNHYNNPRLGPYAANGRINCKGMHCYRRHRVSYSVNQGQVIEYNTNMRRDPRTGWWTNYQRPAYQPSVQPRWWQKKNQY